MALSNVKQVLDKFGKYVVQQSKKNLTSNKPYPAKDTNDLYNSISYKAKQSRNSFEFSISMEDYGKYIDKGVRGSGGVRKTTSKFKSTNNKGKLWKIKAKDSPFKYRDIKPSVKHFEGWSKRKGINPYAVREAVYHQGIATTEFFTLPFGLAFEKLPNEIVEAYGLDMEKFLQSSLNNG